MKERRCLLIWLSVLLAGCTEHTIPFEPQLPSVKIGPYQSHVQVGTGQQLQVSVTGIENTGVYFGYRGLEIPGGQAVNDPYVVRLDPGTGAFSANSVGTVVLVVRSKVMGDVIDTPVVTVDPPPLERRIAFKSIATEEDRSCGISLSHETFCWGANRSGGLGIAATSFCGFGRRETDYPCNPLPGKVAGTPPFENIAVGRDHSCGLTGAGAVHCWGQNLFGEAGSGTTTPVPNPVLVPVPGRVINIAAGTGRSCAVNDSGELYCWGIIRGTVLLDPFGGPGCFSTDRCSSTPVKVEGVVNVSRVYVGHAHTCALQNDGVAFCWGPNGFGQLGTGNYVDSNTPLKVQTAARFTDITVGSTSTCGLTAAGEAYCWGLNGVPTTSCDAIPETCTPVPRLADAAHRYKQLVAKDHGACGITTENEVYCWGANAVVALSGFANLPGPTRFAQTLRLVSLATGMRGCGIVEDGRAYCWASPNGAGEMGNGRVWVSLFAQPPDPAPSAVEGPQTT
jgi:hypothetical protein